MASFSTARVPRRDAQQNRQHILDIAGQAFSTSGVDVSMDAIARQTGLGSGTLYRHFPNKDALLAALLVPFHEELEEQRAAIEAATVDPALMLERWIDALGDWMLAYDGLSEPLRAAWSAPESALRPTCESLIETTWKFLRAAQGEGLAQPTLTGQDIFLGALAVAWASNRTTAQTRTRDILRSLLKNGWAMGQKD